MEIIDKLNESITQTKVFHFQTDNFSTHTALGGLYDILAGHFDDLVEQYIGIERVKNEKFLIEFSDIKLVSIKNRLNVEDIKAYFAELLLDIKDAFTNLKGVYIVLSNVLEDIASAITKFLYQINLM